MRICLISREYPPETGFGGIATFVRHLAHGLKELGNEVEVVALAKESEKVVDDGGVRVHRVLPYPIEGGLDCINLCIPYSRYVLLTTLALWRKFYELHSANPFDVADSPELLAESIYASVLRVVPLVVRLYTPHSKFMAENLHSAASTFDHMFIAALERAAMSAADVLTSPSQDLAEFVSRDLPCPLENIAIVRNPIDPEEFCPDGERALPSDGRKTVLFVGRLEERKGIQYLVRAIPEVLKSCPQTRFVVIGDDTIHGSGGRNSMLTHLKSTLKQHNCENSVLFIPRIPLSELPAYYRSADISVVPSLYDNSPYTCLEAMSCGIAVIGTSAGGTREYIEDGDSGIIVAPRSPEALAGALINLLHDDSYRSFLAKNARKRVLEKFQRKKIASDTLELYHVAIKRFKNSRSTLYPRPVQEATADAAGMLFAFDSMLYNKFYQMSWRFRIRHWFLLLKRRPRLLAAKAAIAALRPLSRLLYRNENRVLGLQERLESRVSAAHGDPLAKVRDAAGGRELLNR